MGECADRPGGWGAVRGPRLRGGLGDTDALAAAAWPGSQRRPEAGAEAGGRRRMSLNRANAPPGPAAAAGGAGAVRAGQLRGGKGTSARSLGRSRRSCGGGGGAGGRNGLIPSTGPEREGRHEKGGSGGAEADRLRPPFGKCAAGGQARLWYVFLSEREKVRERADAPGGAGYGVGPAPGGVDGATHPRGKPLGRVSHGVPMQP